MGNLDCCRLSGGCRLKAGCSQEWLPHRIAAGSEGLVQVFLERAAGPCRPPLL